MRHDRLAEDKRNSIDVNRELLIANTALQEASSRDNHFAAIYAKVAELERQLDEQRNLLAEQKCAFEAELAKKQATIAQERCLAEAYRQNIDALRNSMSWRIMSPARLAGDVFHKLHQIVLGILYRVPALSSIGKELAKIVYVGRFPGGRMLLPTNPLFDSEFYIASNSDVKRDPWAHYIGFGSDEGRDPHPLFDTSFYLATNPDVASSGLNPLLHYFTHGAAEKRRPHSGFDPSLYLMQRPDLKQKGVNPLLHYWQYGRHEGVHSAPPRVVPLSPERAVLSNGPLHQRSPKACGAGQPASEATNPDYGGNRQIISILLPTFNTPPNLLQLAIHSVRRQTYSHWQLCIYDDGSSREETLAVLTQLEAGGDPRIVVQYGTSNKGISRASNAALTLAQGEYVGILDHDDELEPDALAEVAQTFAQDPSLDALYTDQDYIDVHGCRTGTLLKPDWSPEMFRGVMFVNHMLVVRTSLIRGLGALDPEFDGIQDFEFMLRLSEATSRIGHVCRILYHSRSIHGSVASAVNSKGVLRPLQAEAVNRHLSRCGIRAIAAPHPLISDRLRLLPADRSRFPRVVIAVRSSGLASAAETVISILEQSTYLNLTVCVPAPLSQDLPDDRRIVIRDFENVKRQLLSEDFLVQMDDDLRVVTPNWIEILLMYCEQQDVACASPLILHDRTVWSAGLVFSMNAGVDHVMRGWAPDIDGYAGSLSCSREVSAVSGECMMISGSMFQYLGGNIKYYTTSIFDGADLALRGFSKRRRNIVTPRAVVENARCGARPACQELDQQLFLDRWRDLIRRGDPFYNPNFSLTAPVYSVDQSVAAVHS
jgi:glycosyltransferase involved in cell wall biosynthesis